jgi:hypothetical protein
MPLIGTTDSKMCPIMKKLCIFHSTVLLTILYFWFLKQASKQQSAQHIDKVTFYPIYHSGMDKLQRLLKWVSFHSWAHHAIICQVATINRSYNTCQLKKAAYPEFSSIFTKCFDICPWNRIRMSTNPLQDILYAMLHGKTVSFSLSLVNLL